MVERNKLDLHWSFSSLEGFKTCPRQFEHVKLKKLVPESKNEATLWGTRVHEALEQRLRDGIPLPPSMKDLEVFAVKFLNRPGTLYVEKKLAVNRQYEPVDWNAPDVWCKGIVDVAIIDGTKAVVVDHKTGRIKPQLRQLKLFALLTFAHFPEVQTCKTMFAWIKFNESTKAEYKREDLKDLWGEFLFDVSLFEEAILTDTFNPRPSGLCNGWCPVKTCEFWREKRK